MATLRSPQGCPWDQEQTHQTIRGHLVEEAFEVVDALENEDFDELKEELGDLMLQIVFHAQMAAESDRFTIDDVTDGIVTKLKRRHPHIFGTSEAKTAAQVLSQWERIKATEKDRASVLDGVPKSMPALACSQKMQEKAARSGFDWKAPEDVLDKLVEEVGEFEGADSPRAAEDEFGDILFTLVNYGRHLGIDSELALRRTCRKFRRRFKRMEEAAASQGLDFDSVSLEDKERLWQQAKEDLNDDD